MRTALRHWPWIACTAFSIGQLITGSGSAADKPVPPSKPVPATPAPAQGATNGLKVAAPDTRPDTKPAIKESASEVDRRETNAAPAKTSKAPDVDRADRGRGENPAATDRREAGDPRSSYTRGPAAPARTSPRSGSFDSRAQNPQRDREPRRDQDNAGAVRHQVNRPITNDRNSDLKNGRTSGAATVDSRGQQRSQGNLNNLGLNLGAATAAGLLISSIGANSAFSNVGFQPDDRIVSFGGQQFASQAQLYNYLATVPAGQQIPIVVNRGGQQQTLAWTPDDQFAQQFAGDNSIVNQDSFLGIHLDDQVHDAAIVAQVEPNSPADQAGVRLDDMIVAVAGKQVSNPQQFADTVANLPAGPVELSVSRTMNLQVNPEGTARVQPATQAPALPPAPVLAPQAVQPVVTPAPQPVQPVAPQPVRRGLLPGLRNR